MTDAVTEMLNPESENPSAQLERLFLRLALINDDRALENFTQKSLLQIITILSEGEDPIRQKGMELLNHLSRRIKQNFEIKLPLRGLMDYIQLAYTDNDVLRVNFAIVYFKMAVKRLDEKAHLDVLPMILNLIRHVLQGKSVQTKNRKIVNQLLCTAAESWIALSRTAGIGTASVKNVPNFDALECNVLRSELLLFMEKLLYMEFYSPSAPSPREIELSSITVEDYSFLGEELFGNENNVNLLTLNMAIIKILSTPIFLDIDALPLLILASGSNFVEVKEAAVSEMKKFEIDATMREKKSVSKLFRIYLGDKRNQINPTKSVKVKVAILKYLVRSEVAPAMFTDNMAIACDGLFGLNMTRDPTKLRQLSAQFLYLQIKKIPQYAFQTMSPIYFSALMKLHNERRLWSITAAVCYRSMAEIGRTNKQLVINNLTLVHQLFDLLGKEHECDINAAIVECLTAWLPAFCETDEKAHLSILRSLLSMYIKSPSTQLRQISIKYAASLAKSAITLGFLWMLCEASTDCDIKLQQEALSALNDTLADHTNLLNYEELVEFFHGKVFHKKGEAVPQDGIDQSHMKAGAADSIDSTLPVALNYLMAVVMAKCDNEPVKLLDGSVVISPTIMPKATKFLRDTLVKNPLTIEMLFNMVLLDLESHTKSNVVHIAVIVFYCKSWKIDEERREKLCLILSCALETSVLHDPYDKLAELYVASLNGDEILSIVEIYNQSLRTKELLHVPWVCVYLMRRSEVYANLSLIDEFVNIFVSRMVSKSNVNHDRILEFFCGAFAELLRQSSAYYEVRLFDTDEKFYDFCKMLCKLASSRKNASGVSITEPACRCLGYISKLNMRMKDFQHITERLIEVGESSTSVELQFMIGESLLDAVLGEASPSRRNFLANNEAEHVNTHLTSELRPIVEERAKMLFDSLIYSKLKSGNHNVRQAAIIWLFVFTKKGLKVKIQVLFDQLRVIQASFIDGLTENNDFTQDVASKGLSLLFEHADDSLKQTILDDLTSAVVLGRQCSAPISADTKLFGDHQLGSTPSGESLTTYREICSLATDCNQPDLIYKFLQVAKHSSLWNSKKGAAFGFNMVYERAAQKMKPYLSKLVPKLYRYRYDPDLKVRSSMVSLWNVVISSEKNAVEEYADNIFDELLSTLTSEYWRMRESSCLALADFLSTHFPSNPTEKFDELYASIFRVLDDIKESVRSAALKALKTLIKVTCRECSSCRGEKGMRLLGVVLPVIIEKGCNSSVKMVSMLSLNAIVDLSKEAGQLLRPHLLIIVRCLLYALSEIEPSTINYLAVRASESELEAIDAARTMASSSSLMVTTLYDLVPIIDDTILAALFKQLSEHLRSNIGLNTRTGTCQFIVQICLRQKQLLIASRAACDKLLQALCTGMQDRNATIRKQYFTAIAYLLKFCSQGKIDNLLKLLRDKLESDDEDAKEIVVHLVRSIAFYSSDSFESCLADLFPHIYLASVKQVELGDEVGKKRQILWQELISELVTDGNVAIRRYRKEMLKVCHEKLTTSSVHAVKTQAAIMLVDVVEASWEAIESSEANELFDTVTVALKARFWDGKEKVLSALRSVIVHLGGKLLAVWNDDQVVIEKKFAPLWKESQRKEGSYSGDALFCASLFFEKCNGQCVTSNVLEFLIKYIDNHDSKFDSKAEETGDELEARNQILKNRDQYFEKVVESLPHVLVACSFDDCVTGLAGLSRLLMAKTVHYAIKNAAIREMASVMKSWKRDEKFEIEAVWIAVANLLLENHAQRPTFARECGMLLTYLNEGVRAKRFEVAPSDDLVIALKENSLIKSLRNLLQSLNIFSQSFSCVIVDENIKS